MTIEVECPSCHKKIKAPEKFAGKAAKCPGCKGVIKVPAAAGEGDEAPATRDTEPQAIEASKAPAAAAAGARAASKKPAAEPAAKQAAAKPDVHKAASKPAPAATKEEWYIQTDEGEQYGPVTKEELDEWVAEERVDASCQILKEGWSQWQWAEEVYPELAEASQAEVDDNPFAGLGAAASPAAAINPFASPQAESVAVERSEPAGDGEVVPISTTMRRALQQTRPWVMVMSIVWFIGAALGGLGAVLMLVFGFVMISQVGLGGVPMLLFALIYGGLAAVLVFLGLHSHRYASAINAFLRSKDGHDLDRGLDAQKTTWKIMAIMTLAMIAVSVIMPILMMALGVAVGAATMNSGPPPGF